MAENNEVIGYERGRGERSGATMVEGVILVILGILAIAAPYVTTLAVALVLPIVLLIKGVAEIIAAFAREHAGSRVWAFIVGVVAILAALVLFARPLFTVATLAMVVIAYLIIDGIVRIVGGFAAPEGRAWIVLAGVISLILGLLLLSGTLAQTTLLLGVLIGVNVLMSGILLLVLGATPTAHYPGARAVPSA